MNWVNHLPEKKFAPPPNHRSLLNLYYTCIFIFTHIRTYMHAYIYMHTSNQADQSGGGGGWAITRGRPAPTKPGPDTKISSSARGVQMLPPANSWMFGLD